MTVEAGRNRPAGLPFDMPATSRTRDLAWLLLLSMAAAAAALSARGRHRGPPVEAAPPATVPAAPSRATRAALPPAPRARDIRDAVRRVFEGVVVADARRAVAGDFNGDGDLDLAVVARPAAGALERINNELANWTLQDASAPALGAGGGSRVHVAEQDVLLAVIHGHGAGGWRNPQARQSYLVRNSPARPRVVVDARGLAQAGSPCSRGHAIVDAVADRPAFLCWSGSRYVWTPRDPSGTG
jgi:hypothetical protein